MDHIASPGEVDKSRYAPDLSSPPTMYGLSQEVVFCKRCVISNQRPNSAVEYQHTKASKKKTIHFDEEGICDACRFAERKNQVIDWAERERALIEVCNQHRSKDGSYDCIVP